MRRLYFFATVFFWLGVAAFWMASQFLPPVAQPPGKPPVVAPERLYSLVELAAHGTEDDCWMAIRGKVYDLSSYLPDHPSRPELILPWCGKEATEAYNTKSKGRSHSATANALLASFRIGKLAPEAPRVQP